MLGSCNRRTDHGPVRKTSSAVRGSGSGVPLDRPVGSGCNFDAEDVRLSGLQAALPLCFKPSVPSLAEKAGPFGAPAGHGGRREDAGIKGGQICPRTRVAFFAADASRPAITLQPHLAT